MFDPEPIDISGVELSDGLLALAEKIAENNHNIWAKKRLAKGWSFGFEKSEANKESPVLMPFDELPEKERSKRINIASETIKAMLSLGYDISAPDEKVHEEHDFSEPDFTGHDFNDISFDEPDFNEINFNEADLEKTEFNEADFNGIDFEKSKFNETDFNEADFLEIEENDDVIFLSDEKGNEFSFQLLGEVDLDSRTYAVFLPLDSGDDSIEPEIFAEVTINGEKTYSYIDNHSLVQKVLEIFENNKDTFNFD